MPVKLTYSLLLSLTIGLVTSAALIRHKHGLAHSAPATNSATEAPVQEPSEPGPVRMIRFAVTDDGLYPRRINVSKGLLSIALEDETYSSDSLIIESVIGDQRTKISQIDRGPNRRRGRAVVRLGPGHYLVSLANQPNHTADLIVNP